MAEGKGGDRAGGDLGAPVEGGHVDVVPCPAEPAATAREAGRRFGRGRDPAGLDPGGGVSDALAKARHQPLLFKRTDFSQTEVKAAL